MCDTLTHPHVASIELLGLETSHFQKCMYMYGVLCTVRQPHVIKCSFCTPYKGTFKLMHT